MATSSPENITLLIAAAADGDRAAASALLAVVYDDLRRVAGVKMAEFPGTNTLQPTALVHEAYLRLVQSENLAVKDRAEFLHAASRAMRNILVDRIRSKGRIKRGGGMRRKDLDLATIASTPPETHEDQFLALNDALTGLEDFDTRKAKVAHLRLFGKLDQKNIAEALGVSLATVERDWSFAQAWLKRELRKDA